MTSGMKVADTDVDDVIIDARYLTSLLGNNNNEFSTTRSAVERGCVLIMSAV